MLNKIIQKLSKEKDLLKDNIILFASTLGLNFMGYFFHLYIGRTLGPADYGIFGALLSLIYIMIIPLNTIQTAMSRFISSYKVEQNQNKISYLFTDSLKKMFKFSLITVILFLIFSPLIARFLKIDQISYLLLLAPFLFFALMVSITRGVLQGLQKFKKFGSLLILEGIIKLGGGILFLSLGLSIAGAMTAYNLSYLAPFLLSLYFLKFLFKEKKEKVNTKKVYAYIMPILFMLLSLTAFYTLDVLLVKHFFNATQAGYYSALVLLGKIVLFGSVSIPMVMFPKVAELYEQGKNPRGILSKSFILVLLFGGSITSFYFLFPKLTLGLLFGEEYLAITGLLGWYGLFAVLFSLVYLICFYLASIKRTRFIYSLFIFNLLEILLIYLFHNTLLQVIQILLFVMSLLFFTLIYSLRPFRKWLT